MDDDDVLLELIECLGRDWKALLTVPDDEVEAVKRGVINRAAITMRAAENYLTQLRELNRAGRA
jgi:hypothetical protein